MAATMGFNSSLFINERLRCVSVRFDYVWIKLVKTNKARNHGSNVKLVSCSESWIKHQALVLPGWWLITKPQTILHTINSSSLTLHSYSCTNSFWANDYGCNRGGLRLRGKVIASHCATTVQFNILPDLPVHWFSHFKSNLTYIHSFNLLTIHV